MLRVKICCISSHEEASTAIKYGASALGFVSSMPSGPGVISESLIAQIVSRVPPPIGTFLLTSRTDVQGIIAQQRKCGVNTIQICDRISTDHYRILRKNLPGVSLIQVIHVVGEESIKEAKESANYVDALLLDSGNQALEIKELGGTGRTHDWNLSREIVTLVDIPVFLAGGLKPDNVAMAINAVKPFGVDVCSGVRSNNELDKNKLHEFITNVNNTV
ncbi:MAG: phosphoribosylanthranilate isomerase [Deferribacteres bacterium]|nr:phosphoribosylanthranilate isomerase [candidate division KSB1 bacterium]MCB9502342.1 phosphoribosylanthranilate isomerase [Deferribacteres bacterium]